MVAGAGPSLPQSVRVAGPRRQAAPWGGQRRSSASRAMSWSRRRSGRSSPEILASTCVATDSVTPTPCPDTGSAMDSKPPLERLADEGVDDERAPFPRAFPRAPRRPA